MVQVFSTPRNLAEQGAADLIASRIPPGQSIDWVPGFLSSSVTGFLGYWVLRVTPFCYFLVCLPSCFLLFFSFSRFLFFSSPLVLFFCSSLLLFSSYHLLVFFSPSLLRRWPPRSIQKMPPGGSKINPKWSPEGPKSITNDLRRINFGVFLFRKKLIKLKKGDPRGTNDDPKTQKSNVPHPF